MYYLKIAIAWCTIQFLTMPKHRLWSNSVLFSFISRSDDVFVISRYSSSSNITDVKRIVHYDPRYCSSISLLDCHRTLNFDEWLTLQRGSLRNVAPYIQCTKFISECKRQLMLEWSERTAILQYMERDLYEVWLTLETGRKIILLSLTSKIAKNILTVPRKNLQ